MKALKKCVAVIIALISVMSASSLVFAHGHGAGHHNYYYNQNNCPYANSPYCNNLNHGYYYGNCGHQFCRNAC